MDVAREKFLSKGHAKKTQWLRQDSNPGHAFTVQQATLT